MLEIGGLIVDDTVDIYLATKGRGTDGDPTFTYSSTPNQSGFPCSCQPLEAEEVIDEQGRLTEIMPYHVIFNDNPQVKPRDKIQWTDSNGVTHLLFVRATRNEGGANSYWFVRAIERL